MRFYQSPVATGVAFDNSTDGFAANNVQAAIEESLAAAGGLQPSYLGSGLIVNYKAGRASVNGTTYTFTAGTITVAASLTNNFIYVSIAGSMTSGASIPSNAVPIAQFTSGASTITTLTDIRTSLDNNVVFGSISDIQPVVYTTAVAGATNRYADAGHQHVLSITNSELSFSSAITTTSTTSVVITGMTTTPVAGTYLVIFSSWLTNTTGNQQATVSIFVGGTQNAGSVRKTLPFNGAVGSVNDGTAIATNAIVTVNGSQAIAIEWSTAGGTLSAANGTFDIVRLS